MSEREALERALEDMDRKMTRYTVDDGEFVTAYIVPAGPWHKILGLIRGGAIRALQPPEGEGGKEAR